MSITGASTHINASLVWQQLSERLDAFIEAWQDADQPPSLSDFVPAAPAELRRLTLVEAVKIDLEYRWQGRRCPKYVEDYLREFPELEAGGGVSCDVIYEEYHIRRQQGDTVSLNEYCDRFPTREDELRRLFQIESPTQTTLMVATERLPVFEPGQTVDDFELISALGKGAFASVFRARQRSMHRIVALKISRDRSLEPQTLAQLEHPHIVRVFDQRKLADSKLRLLYMQYVPGGTLHGVIDHARQVPTDRGGETLLGAVDLALERNGEQPPTDSLARYKLRAATWPQIVCWLGARLAAALDHAHQHGVLHRDLKPANVLIGADAHPKLADFNISFSKLDGATPAAYFGGTLAYMSPEQLEAYDPAHARAPEELDARSDIYSLGVVLWEFLTLRRPFADAPPLEGGWSQTLPRMAATRRAGIAAEALAHVPAGCPAMVVDVLRKCLAGDPAERYQSAGELARALDLCLQPRAHELLHGRSAWTDRLKRHPVATTISLGLLPNIVMCILNIVYNWIEIVGKLSPEDQRVFHTQVLAINLLAYALGLGYICGTRGRLFRTLGQIVRGERVEPPSLELVRRSLLMGTATALVTTALWSVSGFVFPTWMHFGAGSTSQLSAIHYVHFIVSNLLCGMIAGTQSFYVVTFLSVRYCYPWLFQARTPDARDLPELARVVRLARIFFGATLSVPFLALAALLTIDVGRAVIGVLAAIGFVGCVLAYVLDLAIRADLSALATATNPGGDALVASDSLDSFLTGSRR